MNDKAAQLEELPGPEIVPAGESAETSSRLSFCVFLVLLLIVLVADLLWIRNLYIAQWGYSIERSGGSLILQFDWLKEQAFDLVKPIINLNLVLMLMAWALAGLHRIRALLILSVFLTILFIVNFLAGWYEYFGIGV
jgi:hypothetical protein